MDLISHSPSSHHLQLVAPRPSPASRPRFGQPQPLRPFPLIYHQRHRPMQPDNTQYSPDTCISSLLPPGVDPASVDFRTFYPYVPNEVKHRKRTSRAQLKVLEDVFSRDTKPNAALRKKLAKQLDMTARGVQVWFQNRRAKEKTQAKKALTASKTVPIPDLSEDSAAPKPESPPLSPDLDSVHDLPDSHQTTLDNKAEEPLITSSPVAAHLERNRSWANLRSRTLEETTFATPSSNFQTDAHLHALRRGSLPTISQPPDRSALGGPPQQDLSRRRSVDTSLHRLASHPYASVAMAKNGAIYRGTFPRYQPQLRTSPSTSHPYLNPSPHARTPVGVSLRPSLAHRASLPGDRGIVTPRHRSVYDPRAYRFSVPGPEAETPYPPLSPLLASPHAARLGLSDSHLYAIPTRTVSSPIPGPLPTPNFIFGAPSPTASPSPTGTDGDSPEALSSLPAYLFSSRVEDKDAEDDGTSASYSRFGSIASLAGSESSNTSAYYSDIGSAGYDPEARRGSCTSGQIMELMSGLDVNGQSNPVGNDTYASQEGRSMTSMTNNTGGDDHCGSDSYPSPSSTVSAGHSPHRHGALPPTLPISRSSELAFALHTNNGQPATPTDVQYHKSSDNENVSPFIFGGVSHPEESIYSLSGLSGSSTSSLSLPVVEYSDKYHYENDTYPNTGHFHPYQARANDHYPIQPQFARGEAHHITDFGPSSEGYPTFNADPINNHSSLENPLQSIVQYS